jgi:hypothetical protein
MDQRYFVILNRLGNEIKNAKNEFIKYVINKQVKTMGKNIVTLGVLG